MFSFFFVAMQVIANAKREKIKSNNNNTDDDNDNDKKIDKIDHQLAFMLLFCCRNKSSIFSVSLPFKS